MLFTSLLPCVDDVVLFSSQAIRSSRSSTIHFVSGGLYASPSLKFPSVLLVPPTAWLCRICSLVVQPQLSPCSLIRPDITLHLSSMLLVLYSTRLDQISFF